MSSASRLKLGRLLSERGLISSRGLEAGLLAQRQHSQRLGTTLVRLGLLSFDALAGALGEQLGYPAADRQALERLEPRAVAAIPAELRAKYCILPMRLEGRRLHLAAVDPHHVDLMDHLSRALQVEIRPYVLPQGLFSVYAPRAEQVASGRTKTGPLGVGLGQDSTAARGTTAADGLDAPDELLDLVYLDEVTDLRMAHRATSELEIDISFDESPGQAATPTLEQAVERLRRAERTDDVVAALLQPPVPTMTLVVLMLVRGELASALGAWGSALSQGDARSLVVPLNVPSLLQRCLTERRLAVGDAKGDAIQSMMATFLRAPEGNVGCAVPVQLGQRIVNLVYLQCAEPITQATLAELNALGRHAAETYGRLIKLRRS